MNRDKIGMITFWWMGRMEGLPNLGSPQIRENKPQSTAKVTTREKVDLGCVARESLIRFYQGQGPDVCALYAQKVGSKFGSVEIRAEPLDLEKSVTGILSPETTLALLNALPERMQIIKKINNDGQWSLVINASREARDGVEETALLAA